VSAITEADKAIGLRLRALRANAGMTQGALARMVGTSYQQLHKYERGVNRIAAGRLSTLAAALGVPPSSLMPDTNEVELSDRNRFIMETARLLRELPPETADAVGALVRSLAARS
jgi:transcriptional regulator with XRE-family HTH domain